MTTPEAIALLQLREELQSTRDRLQTTIEDLATTNEELKSSNEELRAKVYELDAASNDLENLLLSTRIATLFLDEELRIKRFTPATDEMFRFRESDVGRPITDIAARFDASRLVDDAIDVLHTLRAKERKVQIGTDAAPYQMRTLPYRLADGTVAGVVITFVDLSAQQLADADGAMLAAIVDSADEAIWAKKLDGTITSWNIAAERLYGFTAPEIIGKSVALVVPPDRMEELRDMHERVARGERVERVETVRITRDGRRLEVSVSIAPIRDRAGTIIGASSISHDVSWRKRAERELVAARDAAESANRAKDQFLSILSHELRTPLTPVLVAAGLLARDASLAPAARSKIELVKRNVELEARLIDDLLDITSIARGEIELHRSPVSVQELAAHSVEVCSADLDAAGVTVDTDVASGLWVEVDTARMQQVLWNLLKNAARFSRPGSRVLLTAARQGDTAVIVVRDSGAGIATDDLTRVFAAFQQAHAGPEKRTGGLGLGLSIGKALVESHGGTLRAASEGLGKGSTFTITLPAIAAPRNAGSVQPEAARQVRVLLVEDHEDTLELMKELLSIEGYGVVVARTVAEALEACATEPFDVVVSDLGLPDGSGFDVVRGAHKQRPDVRAIALSGYGMEDDRKRSAEAGFAEHLVKPVGFRDLQEAIRRAVGR